MNTLFRLLKSKNFIDSVEAYHIPIRVKTNHKHAALICVMGGIFYRGDLKKRFKVLGLI